MAAGAHRNFLPDFIPPVPSRRQPAYIQFPGLRIDLSNAPPARIERYPADRALVDSFFNDIGTEESAFVALALTGLLIPSIPAFLGFRLFGRGLGGFIRTAAVSSITTVYAASYNYELATLRWKTKDPEIKGPDRQTLSFLLSERNRIRKSVLEKAGLWQPARAKSRTTIPHAHPILKNCLFRTQWEVWRWQACLSVLLWTPRIESAWQQTFVDDAMSSTTDRNWRLFFDIPPQPSGGGVAVATVLYIPDWDEHFSSDTERLNALPGYLVRKSLWSRTPHDGRAVIRSRYRDRFPEDKGRCGGVYNDFLDASVVMHGIEERARKYLDAGGERDILEEKEIMDDATMTASSLRRCLLALIECEEMSAVLDGKFEIEKFRPGMAITSVVRMASSQVPRVQEAVAQTRDAAEGSTSPGKGKVSVDKAAEVLPLAGKEGTSSSTTTTNPEKETTPTTGEHAVGKSDKKGVGAEVKKTETDEKGKDETGTGVENS